MNDCLQSVCILLSLSTFFPVFQNLTFLKHVKKNMAMTSFCNQNVLNRAAKYLKEYFKMKFRHHIFIIERISKIFATLFTTFGMQNGDRVIFFMRCFRKVRFKKIASGRWCKDSRSLKVSEITRYS